MSSFVCWPENPFRGHVGGRYRRIIGDHQEVEVKQITRKEFAKQVYYADDRDAVPHTKEARKETRFEFITTGVRLRCS